MNTGIITITQGTNFGNRLQVYAVQKVLKSLGHQPYLILNNTGMNGVFHKCKHAVSILINKNGARYEYKRQKAFNEFDMKYIAIWKEVIDENYKRSSIGESFDAFICGSDQVWNPQIPYLSGACFADFSGNFRRISYAASFGVNKVPEDKLCQYQDWLNKFDAISVREEKGKDIVERITGKESDVLIDPTMMLDSSDWIAIEERPEFKVPEEYIFVYYLGEKTENLNYMIKKMEKKYRIPALDVTPVAGSCYYNINSAQFIYLLHNSRIVITDSFHASVFSILFNKAFRVFDRVDAHASMSSRIDTLSTYFNIENCRNNYQVEIYDAPNYINKDQLKLLRDRAYVFLANALEA